MTATTPRDTQAAQTATGQPGRGQQTWRWDSCARPPGPRPTLLRPLLASAGRHLRRPDRPVGWLWCGAAPPTSRRGRPPVGRPPGDQALAARCHLASHPDQGQPVWLAIPLSADRRGRGQHRRPGGGADPVHAVHARRHDLPVLGGATALRPSGGSDRGRLVGAQRTRVPARLRHLRPAVRLPHHDLGLAHRPGELQEASAALRHRVGGGARAR